MSEIHSSESSKNNAIQHVDDINVVKMRECIRDMAGALKECQRLLKNETEGGENEYARGVSK